jgi:hypothetical protein
VGITAELRPFNPGANAGLLAAVNRVVGEIQYLTRVWEDSFDAKAASEIIKNFAQGSGYYSVGDTSKRKDYVPDPTKPYYTTVRNQDQTEYTFFPKKQDGGGSAQLIVKPDRFGNKGLRCPACFGPLGKKPAVAHSVIPQSIWKKIIRGACEDLLIVVEQNALDGKVGVKPFSTLSKQKSGTPLDEKFSLVKPENEVFLQKLLNDTSIMSTYAAQDNAMKQCLNCETGQADASLMQRLEIVDSGKLPKSFLFKKASYDYDGGAFVGKKLLEDATAMKEAEEASFVKGPTDQKEMFKRKTLMQLSRYLLGIEKAMNEQSNTVVDMSDECPLLALMLDHWDEFCWTFRLRGLTECDAKYDGQIKIG